MVKNISTTIVLLLLSGSIIGGIGCSEDPAEPSPNNPTAPTMVLSKTLVIPTYTFKGGTVTPGSLHNALVEDYYDTYGGSKSALTKAELAARYAVVSAPYDDELTAEHFETILDQFDFGSMSAQGGGVVGNTTWPSMDSFTLAYWADLLATVEQCGSSQEIRDATIAYGAEHGFPANGPYSDAFDVLLNSNEYWHTDTVNKLNTVSKIIAGDTAGTLVGGVGGGIGGFIFGGPIGSIIGGGVGAAILGGCVSIGMAEYLY